MTPLNVAGLPAELTGRKQWFGCRITRYPDGTYTKVPARKWGDRQYWETLTDVLARREWPSFIVADGVVSLDCDDCIKDGVLIDDEVRDFVAGLNSYTEVSVSGRGLHTFALGMPLASFTRRRELWSDGHYISVTGAHWPGTPTTVEDRPTALRQLAESLRLSPTPVGPAAKFVMPTSIPKGARRETIFKFIRSLKAQGLTRDQVRQIIGITASERCEPPLVIDEGWFARSWNLPDRSPRLINVDPSEVSYE
jgi:hypothetical protein